MKVEFELNDNSNIKGTQSITVAQEGDFINIIPQGYGDYDSEDGNGVPVAIELYEGNVRLIISADINEQNPAIISLAKAKESNRQESGAERISILPKFTAEAATELDEVVKKKGELEYLCFQMLKCLQDAGLRRVFEHAMNREIVDEEVVTEFFGKNDPDAGCCAAGNYTVEQLLDEWSKNTERMLQLVSGQK